MGTTLPAKKTPPSAVSPALQPRAKRAPLVHAAMCRFAGEAEFGELTTLNISQSGMLVRGPSAAPVGTATEFKFLLETGFEILSGTGKVARVAGDPDGGTTMGIAFDLLDPPKQRILARIIELHSEDSEDAEAPDPAAG